MSITEEHISDALATLTGEFSRSQVEWRAMSKVWPDRLKISCKGQTGFVTIEMSMVEARDLRDRTSRLLQRERRAGRIKHNGGGKWTRVEDSRHD